MGVRRRSKNRHLVSFGTEGPPHDAGMNLESAASKFVESASPDYSTVNCFTPRQLAAWDSSWLTTLAPLRLEPKLELEHEINSTWSDLGGNLWKPRLLMELCSLDFGMPGDLVVYHDLNIEKYPAYANNLSSEALAVMEHRLGTNQILLFRDSYDPMLVDTKRSVLRELVPRIRWLRSHIWAGCIAFRVGPEARMFFSHWLEFTSRPSVRSPVELDPARVFTWNAPEQGSLTALVHARHFPGLPSATIKVTRLSPGRRITGSRRQFARFKGQVDGARLRMLSASDIIFK